jgi:hypothetical protein
MVSRDLSGLCISQLLEVQALPTVWCRLSESGAQGGTLQYVEKGSTRHVQVHAGQQEIMLTHVLAASQLMDTH